LPASEFVITDCSELDDEITNSLDLIVESEYCGYESTTVVNMLDVPYEVTRQGAGVVEGS
jgi:tRNA A37 threonylcarbamoyladenosine synthetase subunit TsaC/SUA5/YrdC